MDIAYTKAAGRGETDLLLYRVSEALAARGIRCCGTVQINTERAEGPCDMDVRVLPAGPILRISQSLGRASKGCRLDPSVLEDAVGLVESELTRFPDILIVNKFGKHEAEGRGFRDVIAQAIAQDMPVLVGVNALNLDAFDAFTEGTALELEATVSNIVRWCKEALGAKRSAA